MLLTGFAWPRELISCWRSGHQVVDGLLGTVRHLSDLSHLYPMPPAVEVTAAIPVTTVICVGRGHLRLERAGRIGERGCVSLSIREKKSSFMLEQLVQLGAYLLQQQTL